MTDRSHTGMSGRGSSVQKTPECFRLSLVRQDKNVSKSNTGNFMRACKIVLSEKVFYKKFERDRTHDQLEGEPFAVTIPLQTVVLHVYRIRE